MTENGLGDLGATLAAPNSVVPGFTTWITNRKRLGQFLLVRIRTDTSLPFEMMFVSPIPGHPHFPYGFGVPPDAPV